MWKLAKRINSLRECWIFSLSGNVRKFQGALFRAYSLKFKAYIFYEYVGVLLPYMCVWNTIYIHSSILMGHGIHVITRRVKFAVERHSHSKQGREEIFFHVKALQCTIEYISAGIAFLMHVHAPTVCNRGIFNVHFWSDEERKKKSEFPLYLFVTLPFSRIKMIIWIIIYFPF